MFGFYDIMVFTFIFLAVMLCSTSSFSMAGDGTDSFLIIDFKDNELFLDAKGISLGEIINSLEKETAIKIEGLEFKQDQLITFTGNGSAPEILLRKLLRPLGEKNYAYEYADDRLIKVTAFPQSQTLTTKDHSVASARKSRRTSVVEVIGIVEETQAEHLGLKTGDLILTYDGSRLFDYDDLIDASTKNIGPRPVQMIVSRAGKRMAFFLERDFIGVRVRTKRIPVTALPSDLSTW